VTLKHPFSGEVTVIYVVVKTISYQMVMQVMSVGRVDMLLQWLYIYLMVAHVMLIFDRLHNITNVTKVEPDCVSAGEVFAVRNPQQYQ